jgi:hypothetical protein
MAQHIVAFPNLPGTVESGPFRLRLNRHHGSKQITLVYKEKAIATFAAAELADLEEVARSMALFVTDEKLPTFPLMATERRAPCRTCALW